MAWPRCPACKQKAIEEGANPKTVKAPEMPMVDRLPELMPAEDVVHRSYECPVCGHLTWTFERESEPAGGCAPFKYLRGGIRNASQGSH